MSVINDMLKDLDQRSANNQKRDEAVLASSGYNIDSQDNDMKLKIIIGLLVTLTIIVVISSYRFFKSKPLPVNPQKIISQENLAQTDNVKVNNLQQVVAKNRVIEEVAEKSIQDQSVNNVIDASEKLPQKTIVDDNAESVEMGIEEINIPDRVIKSTPEIKIADQTEQLFSSARTDIDNGNLNQAVQKLRQSLAKDNNFHNARALLLTVLLEQNQLEEMNKLVGTSLEQWPDNANYRLMKARLFVKQKKTKDALDFLMLNIPKVGVAADYHALLAYTAQQLQDDKLAAKHYKLLLQSHPNKASWWLGLAVSEERLGNKNTALRAYKQSIGRPGLSQNVLDYVRQRIKVIQGF